MIAFLAFLLLGSAFVLELINSVSVPYIESLYFLNLKVKTGDLNANIGIWGWCASSGGQAWQCKYKGLDSYNNFIDPRVIQQTNKSDFFYGNSITRALVLQPIAAGFTGLAAGAALLGFCVSTFAWVLLAILACLLTIAATVLELVFFIHARDALTKYYSKGANTGEFSANLGNAMWVQVAALAAAVVGTLLMILAYTLNRTSVSERPHEPTPLPMSNKRDDSVYAAPVTDSYGAYSHPQYGYTPPSAAVETSGAGRAYDPNQPYETGVTPYPNRYSQVYNAKEAGSRPIERTKKDERRHSRHHNKRHGKHRSHSHSQPRDQYFANRGSHSRRHSRHTSRGHGHMYDDEFYDNKDDVVPRHSYEYEYDFDAFPARRMSFEYGNNSHVRQRSMGGYSRPHSQAALARSSSRASRLYPADSGEVNYDTLPRRTANDQARWQRHSHRFSY